MLQVAPFVGKDVPFPLLRRSPKLPDEAPVEDGTTCRPPSSSTRTGLIRISSTHQARAHPRRHRYSGLMQERRRELHARIVARSRRSTGDASARDRAARPSRSRGELREKAGATISARPGLRPHAVSPARKPGPGSSRHWGSRGVPGEPGHAGASLEIPPRLRPFLAPARKRRVWKRPAEAALSPSG